MQTFLPYKGFLRSARVLDRQRLGKQRVEALQIAQCLTGQSTGWANHPAVKMWRGHERCLLEYGIAMCSEWIARGYKDTCLGKFVELRDETTAESFSLPPWLGRAEFHSAHRAVLLSKDPAWYGQFGWPEEPAKPDEKGSFKGTYVWPVGA